METLFSSLKAQDMDAVDLSEDELAKSHARYMIGGRPQVVDNERIFRFREISSPFSFFNC